MVDIYTRSRDTFLSHRGLSRRKFLVVGAGALGNEVAKALGLLGAGTVLLVDADTVEPSNLARSVFLKCDDCGRPKAEALTASLKTVFPNTEWQFRNCEIADVGLEELAGIDLILSCVDNETARVEAAWTGLRLNIPIADGGLGGPDYWQGRVSFFPGKQAACFCCKLSPRRRREVLCRMNSAGQSCWKSSELPLPSTPTMAAIIGSLQVDFGLRCCESKDGGERLESSTIELSLGRKAELRQFTTPLSPDCPLHSAAEQSLVPLPHSLASARELLDSTGKRCVELDWTICTSAHCWQCHAEWLPMKRVGWFRRHGCCPQCGACTILEKQHISSLSRDELWADTPLVNLGLPLNHLYALR